MKKVFNGLCAVITIALLVAMAGGCSLLDLNGDGEINTKKFLADFDVGVELVGPSGETYSVASTPDGVDVQATLVDSSGNIYVLGEGVGAIEVINPQTGATGYIRPRG